MIACALLVQCGRIYAGGPETDEPQMGAGDVQTEDTKDWLPYMIADLRHQAKMFVNHRENYTDRGRVCIEAASLIRNGAHQEARAYLESKAVHAIRGVPMGRRYAELLPKSQVLMVSAMHEIGGAMFVVFEPDVGTAFTLAVAPDAEKVQIHRENPRDFSVLEPRSAA